MVEAAEFWPDPYRPAWEELSTTKGESLFVQAAFELTKEAATYVQLAAGIYAERPLERNEAIKRGQLAKLAKLCVLFISTTHEDDGDQHLALARQLIELVATFLYLLDDDNGSRHDAYVEHSLIAEKELWKNIDVNVKARGDLWPIEERMYRSMKKLAAESGLDMQAIVHEDKGRKRIGWPKAEDLIARLGPTAYGGYRVGSSVVHSTWTDIHRHHLKSKEDGYDVNFDHVTPRPQPLTLASALSAHALLKYFEGRSEEVHFKERVEDLLERVNRLEEMHEAWLSKLE